MTPVVVISTLSCTEQASDSCWTQLTVDASVLVAIADTELGGRDEIFILLTELEGREDRKSVV